MKITFDKETNARYVEVNDEQFASNKKIDDKTILYLDENGKITRIELLNVSQRMTKNFLSDIIVRNLVSG